MTRIPHASSPRARSSSTVDEGSPGYNDSPQDVDDHYEDPGKHTVHERMPQIQPHERRIIEGINTSQDTEISNLSREREEAPTREPSPLPSPVPLKNAPSPARVGQGYQETVYNSARSMQSALKRSNQDLLRPYSELVRSLSPESRPLSRTEISDIQRELAKLENQMTALSSPARKKPEIPSIPQTPEFVGPVVQDVSQYDFHNGKHLVTSKSVPIATIIKSTNEGPAKYSGMLNEIARLYDLTATHGTPTPSGTEMVAEFSKPIGWANGRETPYHMLYNVNSGVKPHGRPLSGEDVTNAFKGKAPPFRVIDPATATAPPLHVKPAPVPSSKKRSK